VCGIIGFIADPDQQVKVNYGKGSQQNWWLSEEQRRAEWLQTALIFDTLRGDDSTGVMGRVHTGVDKPYGWFKQTGPGWDFIREKGFQKGYVDRIDEYDVIVGHNRAATMGSVTTDNAHPFIHGDITLVHNGTLRSMADLPFLDKDIKVDSEMIAWNLSQFEPGEADKVLNKLNGAFALVWMDRRDHSVNIVRNTERPLHMTLSYGNDCLYFMSEGAMLEMTLKRHRIQHGQIYQLADHTWLKFKQGDLVPEVRDIVPFRPARQWSSPNSTARTQSGTTSGRGRYSDPVQRKYIWSHSGKVTDLPEDWAEELGWFGLDFNKSYPMRNAKFTAYPQGPGKDGFGYVDGEMYVPDIDKWCPIRIQKVWDTSVQHAENRVWSVTPYFCTWDSGNVGFMGKYLTTYQTAEALRNGPPVEEEERRSIPWDALEDDEDADMVDGPNGGMVTVEEFETLTASGCCMCTGNVAVEDAPEVVWVGERNDQPLCPECAEEATSMTGG
jgi:hypothetical protein